MRDGLREKVKDPTLQKFYNVRRQLKRALTDLNELIREREKQNRSATDSTGK